MTPAGLSGRDAYKDELLALARQDDRVVCIETDVGGHNHVFQAEFPDRFFNLGIAEAAAIDIAVGMAKAGLRPYLSTFATFATYRAAESLKLGLGYIGAPVVLVCPYGGLAGAWYGPTHHAVDDLAVVQAIPGVTIGVPCGEQETRSALRYVHAAGKPAYLRLARNESHAASGHPEPGRINWCRVPVAGAPILVSVGERSSELCSAASDLRDGVGHAQLCWLDGDHLIAAVAELTQRSRHLIFVEEHRLPGSVASTVAVLARDAEVTSVNVGTGWASVGGDHRDVLAAYGVTVEAVCAAIDNSKEFQ
ncbi:hypothetical protein [Nocardia sp. NPDC050793]|uniref:hypothetical protein n=1 Tax=Nocardia sp. NPDC050793 TaxID=3155159 RepID=UPI0034065622